MKDYRTTASRAAEGRIPADPRRRERLCLFWLLVFLALVEGMLVLSDFGLAGGADLRGLAYEYGAFWPGLWDDWTPRFPGQPITMVVSYGFLHAGALHLIVNLVALWSLGQMALRLLGPGHSAFVYAVSLVGGAVVYGALAAAGQPMVGASGALFGLAGAILAIELRFRIASGASLKPLRNAILVLLILNLALWLAMDGLLAWEAHLGGFLAGAAATLSLRHRRRHFGRVARRG